MLNGWMRGWIWGAAILLCGLAVGSRSSAQNATRPPNIVFILADDLGLGETGPYGQTKIRTPRLDRMAAEGMRFTRFYSGSPVCAPSRAAFLTGKHTGHAYVRDNHELGGFRDEEERGQLPLPASEPTVAEWLKTRGYATALVGKWGLGGPGSIGLPTRHGFDFFFGYLDQKQAHNFYPTHLWKNDDRFPLANQYFSPHQKFEGDPNDPAAYAKYRGTENAIDAMTREAVSFVRANAARPFFLYFAPTLPHLALQAPESAVRAYDGAFAETPYLGDKQYLPNRTPRATYAAMISYLDAQVGEVLDAVKQAGLDNNTLIIFTSDNGATFDVGGAPTAFFNSHGGLRGTKTDVYEGGIRVPFIARWPGKVRPGSTSAHIGANWDMWATFAELAGGRAPETSDGVSIAPTLLGRGVQAEHASLYWEFHSKGSSQAVRIGDWKGVRVNVKDRPDAPIELYDLAKDQAESTNVAATHPDIVRRIAQVMQSRATSPIDGWNFTTPTAIATPAAPIAVNTPMAAPEWARLERQLLAEHAPACREFYTKYYDDRGYVQCVLRWGANDGPDDAFENFNRWPELHALGGDADVERLYLRALDGMIRQYSDAKTTETPAGRDGMYVREFSAQSDWMHHGEGLQLFNRLALSAPDLPSYRDRVRRFAAMYMGEDPQAPNYDPQRRIIRSMINGSRGPLLRKATPVDWVGDPFDAAGFVALHGESTYAQFLDHYREYTNVVGDHFLNLVATTLPTNAYLATGDAKYREWLVDYMDAWLARMQANGGVIPSFVDLDGRIGGPDGRWWENAYGWGFSPVNPVTGKREDRNRIPRALVGFSNALLVTGDQKYVDAWRTMIDAVNSHARTGDGGREYPSMHGANGWYGWRRDPWNVGALEVWYWSMRPADRARVGADAWVQFLEGKSPGWPEQALRQDLDTLGKRVATMRADRSTPDKRLADNMLDANPATTDAMVRAMFGALVPSREGGLLNARVRYFDPVSKRAGVPPDVAALVSVLEDRRTVVTVVNLSTTAPRSVVVQAGGYAEHRFESVTVNGQTRPIGASHVTIDLAPGAGSTLDFATTRYANKPTVAFPWSAR